MKEQQTPEWFKKLVEDSNNQQQENWREIEIHKLPIPLIDIRWYQKKKLKR